MISLTNLTKSFIDGDAEKSVLVDINLTIPEGATVAITGESGSGKSTLLHLLGTLETPGGGQMQVAGKQLNQFSEQQADQYRRESVGIVFQHFNLIESLSVLDNIYLPARLAGKVDDMYITSLIEQLGISPLCNKLPATLSGGEQQRVAIARALAHKPALLLADEPTGNLDDHNSQRVTDLLFSVCNSLNTTLVLVTHSQPIAAMADLHFHLNDGRLVEQ